MAIIEGSSRNRPPETPSQDLPTNDWTYIRIGLIILLVAFGVFGGWAATAPLDSAAVAPGRVSVESARKTIQHLEGGIVSRILVASGDQVEQGETLIRLDGTRARSELKTVRSQLWAALARQARLHAERQGKGTIDFPAELTKWARQPEIGELMVMQRQELRARRTSLESEIAAERERITQLKQQIAGFQEQIQSKETLVGSYRKEVEEWRSLYEREMADKKKLREAKRKLAQLKGELGNKRTEIARLRAQIQETRIKITNRKQKFHEKVLAGLEEVQSKVLDLRARLIALRDKLRRTDIIAPVSGEVVNLRVHTQGAVIQAGKPVLDLVPARDQFVIEARVRPTDIDRVHKGLKADIRFSAFSSRSRQTIPGRVVTVSADTLTDEKTDSSYYRARVKVTQAGLKKMKDLAMTLQPGMPAQVMIKTGERTLVQYLADPITDWLTYSFRES